MSARLDELRRRTDDALAPYEREILALWDSGKSIDAIMVATGRTKKAVRTVVENYDDRPDVQAKWTLCEVNIQFVERLRRVHGALIGVRA